MDFRPHYLLMALALSACSIFSSSPPPMRQALPADNCQPLSVTKHNRAGMALYKELRLEPAKEEFLLAVTDGPKCAEAHYNLGLALNYLGEKEEAHRHFIEAADLAPGNKVIWDSPALHPYGDPQKEQKKKDKDTAVERAPGGFGNRGQMGGY